MNSIFKFLSLSALGLVLVSCKCGKDGCFVKDKSTSFHGGTHSASGSSFDEGSSVGYLDPSHQVEDRVFFAFDSSDLSDHARQTLDHQKQWLASNSDENITITGHCDERGTREYNIGLGERRANAAKEYLVMHGVASERITVISKGKDEPIVPGSTEEAWAQNRVGVTTQQ